MILGDVQALPDSLNLSMVQQVFNAPLVIPPATLQISGSCEIGNEMAFDKDQHLTFEWAAQVPDTPGFQMNEVTLAQDAPVYSYPDTLYPDYIVPQPAQQPSTFILPVPSSSSYWETYCTGVTSRNWNVFNTISLLPKLNSYTLTVNPDSEQIQTTSNSAAAFEPFFKTILDTTLPTQWLPIVTRDIPMSYGQGWYTNHILGTSYGTYAATATDVPKTLDSHIQFCPPNGVLAHQVAYTRSIACIVDDEAFLRSTVHDPHVFFINNTPESALNNLTTLPGRANNVYIGNFLLFVLHAGSNMFHPHFPIPTSQIMYNARSRQVFNCTQYTGAASTATSFQNGINYVRQSLNNGLMFPTYKSGFTTSENLACPDFAWGTWEDTSWFGTCDYPKNHSVGYGVTQIISNVVEGPNYIGMPEGFAVRPRYNFTGRMAFLFKRSGLTNDFTELYTIKSTIVIPKGVYTFPKLVYEINQAINKPDANGQYPFYRSIDLREEEVIFTSTDDHDDERSQYKGVDANSVYPYSTKGKKGRMLHAFSGNNSVINIGSSSFGCVVGPEDGRPQFSFCYDARGSHASETTQFTTGLSTFVLNSFVAHTGWDPDLVGNYGQAQAGTSNAKTTPDTWFMANTVGLGPWLLSNATHNILEGLDLSLIQQVNSGLGYTVSPTSKNILNGASYSTTVNWTYANYNVVDQQIASLPVNMTAYGSDLGSNLNGFIYCNPCGPRGVPGFNGMQLLSIGDGSDEQNAFIAKLGFNPATVRNLWKPKINVLYPIEGAGYDSNNQPFFDPDLFVISDQSPHLYSKISPVVFKMLRFKNQANWALEANAYIQNLYKLNTGVFGSPRGTVYNPNVALEFPLIRHPIFQLCAQERTAYNIGAIDFPSPSYTQYPVEGYLDNIPRNLFDIDCTMLPSLAFAKQYGAWSIDALFNFLPKRDSIDVAEHPYKAPRDSEWSPNITEQVGFNVYKTHSCCPRPLINRPNDADKDQAFSWIPQTSFASFASSPTIVPPVAVTDAFQRTTTTYQPRAVWHNVPGTTGTFVGMCALKADDYNAGRPTWSDTNDIFYKGFQGLTSFWNTNWFPSENLGPTLGNYAQMQTYIPDQDPDGYYTGGGMTVWGIADWLTNAMCVVPTYGAFTGKSHPPEAGKSVYIQNITDKFSNALYCYTSNLSMDALNSTTNVKNWINNTVMLDSTYGYITKMGGLNRVLQVMGQRIPMQGRVVCDRLATYYFNACPMQADAGFWGLVSEEELKHSSCPDNNVLKRMYNNRVGKETRHLGFVTNYSIYDPNVLCQPFSAQATKPYVTTDAISAARRFDQDVIAPLEFDPQGNVDYSQCVQITNPQSKILEAPTVPISNPELAQSGFIFMRLSALQFSTPVNEYVNGHKFTDSIPLDIAPTSNEALSSITFSCDVQFSMPAQQLSYIRAEFFDASGNRLTGINNLKIILLFTHNINELTEGQANFQSTFAPSN